MLKIKHQASQVNEYKKLHLEGKLVEIQTQMYEGLTRKNGIILLINYVECTGKPGIVRSGIHAVELSEQDWSLEEKIITDDDDTVISIQKIWGWN